MERRRTARGFDPSRPLGSATLAEILGLASLAPSAFNLQPWRFLIVQSRKNLDRLLRGVPGPSGLGHATAAVIVLGYQDPHRADIRMILNEIIAREILSTDQARGVTAIAQHVLETHPDRGAWAARTAMMSAALLMVAAESLGVASAWIDFVDPNKLRDDFGIPDDHAICGVIALGYATDRPSDPGRMPLAEVCFGEHFGVPWEEANRPPTA